MKRVLERVIKEVTPGWEESKANQKMFEDVRAFIKGTFKVEAELMGSVAKGTSLAGDKDLDIFIFFDPSTPRETLEKRALAIGKEVFNRFDGKFEIAYAEHPYTKGKIKGFDVEIVPAYRIATTAELQSAVDRTPFHTRYVLSNLKPSRKRDVRLLKRFMKGVRVYGSDLKTEGFSGYACELLVLKYGTFEKVLAAAQSWAYQEITDIELSYPGDEATMIRSKFSGQPFIFIDPTDSGRNVTAVLSKKQYSRFIFFSRMFLEKPDYDFFFPPPERVAKKRIVKDAIDRGTTVLVIDFPRPDVVDDIIYPQLRRFNDAVSRELSEHGFSTVHSWVFADKECGLGLEIPTASIPKSKTVLGPSIFNPPEHQRKFVEKYKKVWFEDDRFVAEVNQDFDNIHELVNKHILEGRLLHLKAKGIPENIAKAILKKRRVSVGKEIERIGSKEFWVGIERERVK